MALDDLFGELGIASPDSEALTAQAAAPSGKIALGQQIRDYFISKGYSPEQASAVAANMAWESGGSPSNVTAGDNIRNSPRSPHSVGVGQWNDRAPALFSFARKQGIDIPEGSTSSAPYMRDAIKRIPLQTQLDFALSEMDGPERRAGSMIRGAQNLDDALKGGISYHRPAGWSWANPAGGHGYAERGTLAKTLLASPAAPDGSPAAAVAGRFGAWDGGGAAGSPAATPGAPAAPGSDPTTQTADASEQSPMASLLGFLRGGQGGDPIQAALQGAVAQSDQKQEAANAAAAADPVLKVPLKQADMRSVLELIQRMGARGPLGTMGA